MLPGWWGILLEVLKGEAYSFWQEATSSSVGCFAKSNPSQYGQRVSKCRFSSPHLHWQPRHVSWTCNMTGGCGTCWYPHWNWTASTPNVLYLQKSKDRPTIRPLWACCQGFLIAEELKREAIAVRLSKGMKMQTVTVLCLYGGMICI